MYNYYAYIDWTSQKRITLQIINTGQNLSKFYSKHGRYKLIDEKIIFKCVRQSQNDIPHFPAGS